jgi:hypothetical protein
MEFVLSVTKAGTGGGTVTSSPAGIICGADCSESYASGTSVTLTATSAAGSTFGGWSGACAGAGACTLSMTEARSVTATFNKSPVVSYSLTVTKAGTGGGTVTSSPAGIICGVDCSESYASGTSVTLTATSAAGSTFGGWSGACAGAGTCTLIMTEARSVTAAFNTTTIANSGLTLTKAGTGSGIVVSKPGRGIDCGADCWESYPSGTIITLTALPTSLSNFGGWSGACTGTGPCNLNMTEARAVTATFNNSPVVSYSLTVTKAGAGSGSVAGNLGAGIDCGTDCGERYPSGTLVILNATPAQGSVFTGWQGACTGSGPCRLYMTVSSSVTANFDLSRCGL